MKRQKIFDDVVKHLAQQGKRSIVGDTCVYRRNDGLKCGIGGILPDHLYDEKMEGQQIDDVMREFPKIGEYFGVEPEALDCPTTDLLMALQSAHDARRPANVNPKHGGIDAALIRVANNRGLKADIVKKFSWPNVWE